MTRKSFLGVIMIFLLSHFNSGCSAPGYMITPPSQGSAESYEFDQWHREYKERRGSAIFDNYFMVGSLGAVVVGGASSQQKTRELVGGLGLVGFGISYFMLKKHSAELDNHLNYGAQKGWVQKTYD